jgi:hypothetical protein
MKPLDRRKFLVLAAVPAVAQTGASSLFVCMHEASSAGFDFRAAMEGYAKAGIRAVEVMLTKVREFAEKESPAPARRLLQDLALRPVSRRLRMPQRAGVAGVLRYCYRKGRTPSLGR